VHARTSFLPILSTWTKEEGVYLVCFTTTFSLLTTHISPATVEQQQQLVVDGITSFNFYASTPPLLFSRFSSKLLLNLCYLEKNYFYLFYPFSSAVGALMWKTF